MKKVLILLALLTLLLIPSSFAATTNPAPINIYKMDGTTITLMEFTDAKPFIDANGRSMIPLRAVSENLGAEVTWNSVTSTAKVVLGQKTIELPNGKSYGIVNGVKQEFDTITIVSNGRTFVPLRFVSESLGYQIGYKFGKDPLANNLLAHIITIGMGGGVIEVPMVDRGYENSNLSTDEMNIYFSMFKKVPASNEGGATTQVMNTGKSFRMASSPSAGSTGLAFDDVIIVTYHPDEYISIDIAELPTGFDEFFINTLAVMLGKDGTVIGTQLAKDIMSTYNKNDNIYYTSKLAGKTIVSGKYTLDYNSGKISWTK